MITSAAETPSPAWMSAGVPRPLSSTETEPSASSSISTRSQCPASASSMALSETSNTMWCRPEPSSVSPMYMPGRLRTASRPLRTLMESAPYSPLRGVLSVGSAMADHIGSGGSDPKLTPDILHNSAGRLSHGADGRIRGEFGMRWGGWAWALGAALATAPISAQESAHPRLDELIAKAEAGDPGADPAAYHANFVAALDEARKHYP